MVAANRQHWVSVLGGLPAEEAFVEADRWLLNRVGDFSSLPSVPLGFLDELAGYAVGFGPIRRVDEVVQLIVCGRSVVLNCRKGVRCKRFEDAVRVLEFAVLAVREWQKVELQNLLRRYLPQQANVVSTTSIGEIAESVPQFLSMPKGRSFLAVIL